MRNQAEFEGSRDILQALQEDSRNRLVSRFLRKLCGIAMVVGVLNFVLFFAETSYLGGDAVNGKAEGGKYYLWGYHDGSKGYTEVSQAVFNFSKWHVYSMMITLPVMMLAGFAEKRMSIRPED